MGGQGNSKRASVRAIPVSGVGFWSWQHTFRRAYCFMQANGQAGEQGKGRRACYFCERGGALELVTHIRKSVCVFLGGHATTVNEFLVRYHSISTYHVSVNASCLLTMSVDASCLLLPTGISKGGGSCGSAIFSKICLKYLWYY